MIIYLKFKLRITELSYIAFLQIYKFMINDFF